MSVAASNEPRASGSQATGVRGTGLKMHRYFTKDGQDPFDTVSWSVGDVVLRDAKGKTIFEQKDVEAPTSWSKNAVTIVAQKYFRGTIGEANRETSVRQVITRVAYTIAAWGAECGYFATTADAAIFRDELVYLLVNQMMAFNSPVWFNVGAKGRRQAASACYIQSVEDSMDSILTLAKNEGMLFKDGSGSGSNLSKLRSSRETLSTGGTSSGPVSFMRGFDSFAGVIKSGGSTRRAAKMAILNVEHPDIVDFIECKAREEKKAWALIDAGYDGGFNVPWGAYDSIAFQNANHSVRVSDAFMRAVEGDGTFATRYVKNNDICETHKARELFRKMAQAAWECGDPGIQYDDTINKWHTSIQSGRINGSNPCSEFMYLDDTACNLASLNLMKFVDAKEVIFDANSFKQAVETTILAQEILVGKAEYPTEKITRNSLDFRPLGLGYANLGALLMSWGLPYDSVEGRNIAATITALMTGHAYLASARIAEVKGPFAGFDVNRQDMLRVIRQHKEALEDQLEVAADADMRGDGRLAYLYEEATNAWRDALSYGQRFGYRNGQVTVLAPTGTIGFMMDCDTTGIEPELALVKYKTLVGGGSMKLVNGTVEAALKQLGYGNKSGLPSRTAVLEYIKTHDTIEGAPGFRSEHLPVFDCAFKPTNGTRSIHHMGHVRMMAACQPFLSGAISKCVTGETILATSRGLRRIESFYTDQAPDSFSELNIKVPRVGASSTAASSFYFGGERKTWTAQLGDGRRITGTDQHRVRVATPTGLEWRKIVDLQPNDFVALQIGTEMWGEDGLLPAADTALYGSQKKIRTPERMSPDLALFLGMITADGHLTESTYTIGITKNCVDVLDRFVALSHQLFGLEARYATDPRNGVTSAYVASKTLFNWLNAIGFSKQHVPDVVLGASRESILMYLSGLYLDGYITATGQVAISQKFGSLLRDVQIVWDNLGVPTYFTSNNVNGVDYPVLHVRASHRRTAGQLLTWLEPHKQQRVQDLSNSRDTTPFPLHRERLCAAIHAAKRTQEFRSCLDTRTQFLTRHTFLTAAATLGLELTDEEMTYTYVPVSSVEYSGEALVYDISVPETETFVGNGIVNHNTVNMPAECTVEDIEHVYMEGWKLGLKAIAVYRDGCKRSQPLSTKKESAKPNTLTVEGVKMGDEMKLQVDGDKINMVVERKVNERRRLPVDRVAKTHKFSIAGHEGYLTVGLYDDGTPGELFVRMSKQGSTVAGLMDSFGMAISFALQYGTPLQLIVDKFKHMRFEPAGWTENNDIKRTTSLMDYIARWLEQNFLQPKTERWNVESTGTCQMDASAPSIVEPTVNPYLKAADDDYGLSGTHRVSGDGVASPRETRINAYTNTNGVAFKNESDAPPCSTCGTITVRNGACHRCPNCGESMGCS